MTSFRTAAGMVLLGAAVGVVVGEVVSRASRPAGSTGAVPPFRPVELAELPAELAGEAVPPWLAALTLALRAMPGPAITTGETAVPAPRVPTVETGVTHTENAGSEVGSFSQVTAGLHEVIPAVSPEVLPAEPATRAEVRSGRRYGRRVGRLASRARHYGRRLSALRLALVAWLSTLLRPRVPAALLTLPGFESFPDAGPVDGPGHRSTGRALALAVRCNPLRGPDAHAACRPTAALGMVPV